MYIHVLADLPVFHRCVAVPCPLPSLHYRVVLLSGGYLRFLTRYQDRRGILSSRLKAPDLRSQWQRT